MPCLPQLLAKKEGGIIHVASIAGLQPMPYMAVYAATKAFVISFSEALAGECQDRGLTILALCPGSTDTSFSKVAGAESKEMPAMDAYTVARQGLHAFSQKRSFKITGFANYMIGVLPRLFTRKASLAIVKAMFKDKVKLY